VARPDTLQEIVPIVERNPLLLLEEEEGKEEEEIEEKELNEEERELNEEESELKEEEVVELLASNVEDEDTLPVNVLLAIAIAPLATNVANQVILLVIAMLLPLKSLEVYAITVAAEATLPENVPMTAIQTVSDAVPLVILQEIALKRELTLLLAIATTVANLVTLPEIAQNLRTNLLSSVPTPLSFASLTSKTTTSESGEGWLVSKDIQ